jgi:hypothetical protein
VPHLQIDGETIAEIDQATADDLLRAAKPKIGKVREPGGHFQRQVSTEMRRPSPPSIAKELTIDFLAPF